jgi:hypothetical protein
MTSDVLLVGSVAVVLASVGASALVGFEAGRTEQIAAAWADGCEQLAVWWAAARPRLHAARVAVWRWALAQIILPARGCHRGEAGR